MDGIRASGLAVGGAADDPVIFKCSLLIVVLRFEVSFECDKLVLPFLAGSLEAFNVVFAYGLNVIAVLEFHTCEECLIVGFSFGAGFLLDLGHEVCFLGGCFTFCPF